jgi:hypothetical protein
MHPQFVKWILATMKQPLTQSDVEWLRCLTIGKNLVPVLPDDVVEKLEEMGLLATLEGRKVVTPDGREVLHRR